jgi:formate C-acetyltransferase
MAVLPREEILKEKLTDHAIKNTSYRTDTKACMERARLWTESFRESEGQPMVIRRAKALANYLEKKTIFITAGELIVGATGKDPNSIPFYPEINEAQRLKTDIVLSRMLSADEQQELEEILDYWKGKTLEEVCLATLPDEAKKAVYPPEDWKQVDSHHYAHPLCAPTPDLEMLLSTGLYWIMKKVEARLARLDLFKLQSNALLQETIKKMDTLNAMLIVGQGAIRYARRYSELAKKLAEKETDPIRKKELGQIGENCARVPAEPAETFWQAIQAIWFVHLIDHCFEGPAGGLGQRFDQLLYPYYKRDVDAGRLTRETAQELFENLWIKYERSMNFLQPRPRRERYQGGSLNQNITIGGVDEDGNDTTNELSYLILDTTKSIRTVQPTISLMYNDRTPDDLLVKAWEVIMSGLGMPAIFNDGPVISHLLNRGIALKDARNNAVMGCMGINIPGKNTHTKGIAETYISIAKCLELALNDGVDILDGKQIGPNSGDPKKFGSIEGVMGALGTQIEYAARIGVLSTQIYRLKQAELLQRPFSSLLYKSAIERAEDVTSYEDYYWPWINITGAIDAADSLAAIKMLIFDDKKLTWDELLEALKADFDGCNNVRQLCLSAPKFGSDDDYVDKIAKDVFRLVNSIIEEIKDIRGVGHRAVYQSVAVFVRAGVVTAALPCGRKARQPLADGGASPEAGWGGDPIKVLRSVSKLDAVRPVRILLNQRIAPGTTARQFVNFIRAWGDLGCSHTQFNVFDVETLKDAQDNPEKYPDLIVRVAGYSVRFVYLDRTAQDAIIARAEQGLSS